MYIPELSYEEHEGLASVAAKAIAVLTKLKTPHTIFGRVEFLVPYSSANAAILRHAGLQKSHEDVQPAFHHELDLQPMLHDIVAAMRPKGRYNIKVAQKHGVVVERDVSKKGILQFAEIMYETAERQGYAGRSAQYILDLVHVLDKEGMGGLWLARYNGVVLAGAMVAFYQGRASYLYGASAAADRQVMAPYVLHYTLIEEAKRRGCDIYDFIGVAPPDASSSHAWTGISRFKREFGGQTKHYLGSFDMVYRKGWYSLYRLLRQKQ